MNTMTKNTPLPSNGQLIDQSRSDISRNIEAINHMLTVWFMQHKGCENEIEQYHTALDQLYVIAGNDDEAASYLQYALARDWFRSLYGHDWSE